MKIDRHQAILQLVNNNNINTQEELLSQLNSLGYNVTQATVSRDIRELRIIKTLSTDGKYIYTTGGRNSLDKSDGFKNLFSSSVQSVDSAENIVVIKTFTGMAQAVCASLDNMELEDIVGTIAGDDTIFVLCRNIQSTQKILVFCQKLL